MSRIGFIAIFMAFLAAVSAEAEVDSGKLSRCDLIRQEISKEIKNGKRCESVNDCVEHDFGCPFGCGTALRKDNVAGIRRKIDKYREMCPSCRYKCGKEGDSLECVASACTLR